MNHEFCYIAVYTQRSSCCVGQDPRSAIRERLRPLAGSFILGDQRLKALAEFMKAI